MARHHKRVLEHQENGASVDDAVDLSIEDVESDNKKEDYENEDVGDRRKQLSSPEVERFVESVLRMERKVKDKGSPDKNTPKKGKTEKLRDKKKRKKEKRRRSSTNERGPDINETRKEDTSVFSSGEEEIEIVDEKELEARQLRKRRPSHGDLTQSSPLKAKKARRSRKRSLSDTNEDGENAELVKKDLPEKDVMQGGEFEAEEKAKSSPKKSTAEKAVKKHKGKRKSKSEPEKDNSFERDEELANFQDALKVDGANHNGNVSDGEAEIGQDANSEAVEAEDGAGNAESDAEPVDGSEDEEYDKKADIANEDVDTVEEDVEEISERADLGFELKDVRRANRPGRTRQTRSSFRRETRPKVETGNSDEPIELESSSEDDDMFEKGDNVIEIASDSDEDAEEESRKIPRTTSDGPRSEIQLLSNFGHELSSSLETSPDINTDTVSVHELLGDPYLVESVQFNFNVDVEYFLTFLHPDFLKKRRKLTFITGTPFLANHPRRKEIEEKCNIREVIANLPNRFASHHSKMMVNHFASGAVEIIILTANITQLDFSGLTQACWRSGKLYPGKTIGLTGKRFRLDLMRYLARYKQDVTNDLLKKLDHLNYSDIKVELVASAPGTFAYDDIPKGDVYGFGKLRQVLERNNLLLDENEEGKYNVLAQITSIAYPFRSSKNRTSSVFSHLLCPLFFKDWQKDLAPGGDSFQDHQDDFGYKAHIVFPTVEDIRHSNFGYFSGSAIHFKYTDTAVHQAQYEQNIKPYLYKWNYKGTQTGRELLPPHVKYYAVDNADNWKTLKWVLVGSHNLSKQAWGQPLQRSNNHYEVGSYELSVLIPGNEKQLVPTYKRDTLDDVSKEPIRFPFAIPPIPYSDSDKPWSPGFDLGNKKDRWGNTHHGSFAV